MYYITVLGAIIDYYYLWFNVLLQITVGKNGWRVFRTYNQFRDFHVEMSTKYAEVGRGSILVLFV